MSVVQRLALVCAVGLSASAALAQSTSSPPSNARDKGVRVLQPGETVGNEGGAPPPAAAVSPSPAPLPSPIAKLCAKPFAATDVRWDETPGLDKTLSNRLKSRQRVVVDLTQPFPERSAPPAGLSRWLSEVEKGGGKVTVAQYCKAARGGLGSWLAQLTKGRGAGGVYKPARQYDVILHADYIDRVVTQVEFVPKSTSL